MPVNKLFSGGIDVLGQALNLRYEKQGLIQSNIANMETPGYKVRDFPFARVMESVMSGQGDLARTNSKHISPDPADTAKSRIFTDEDRPVDLDEEMMKLSENQLMYDVSAQMIAKKFEWIKYAIDEGGK